MKKNKNFKKIMFVVFGTLLLSQLFLFNGSSDLSSEQPEIFSELLLKFKRASRGPDPQPQSYCMTCDAQDELRQRKLKPQLEDPINDCGGTSGGRLYYEDILRSLPEEFRMPRDHYPTRQISASCMSFAMRDWMDSKSSAFGLCKDPYGPWISRIKRKPCVTESYLYFVYNATIDVAECLDVDTKLMAPKIFQESGFHVNALSRTGAIGSGQLTSGPRADIHDSTKGLYTEALNTIYNGASEQRKRDLAISNPYISQIVEEELESEEGIMKKNSSKKSCQNLIKMDQYLKTQKTKQNKKYAGLFVKNPKTSGQICSFISPPEGPYKNILYTAIYTKYVKKTVSSRTKNILDKITIQGNPMSDIKAEKINNMVSLLSYNAGFGQAPRLLQGYVNLRGRVSPAKKNDFAPEDFSISDDEVSVLKNVLLNTKVKYIIDSVNIQLARVDKKYPNNKKYVEAEKMKTLKRLVKHFKTEVQKKPIPFGVYVLLHQKIGEEDFLYSLKHRAESMERSPQLGKNICAEDKYLEF